MSRSIASIVVLLMYGTALLAQPAAKPAEDYPLTADSTPQEGVPRGTVTKHSFTGSKIFPGTVRDYWVYVPTQYKADEPACVMVFQDGGGYVNEKGNYRATVVFDNLIHKKEMPVTIGIFINPGVIPAPDGTTGLPRPTDKVAALPRYNRCFEYDTLSDAYARFLLEEMLPEVGKNYNLTTQATGRAICGASSGGICAFTAAWQRPDAFLRVVSFIGSYTDLRGGNDYPALIRKTEPRPIRVFLQDGRNDLDIYAGSWWMANQDMASALKFAGYEHQFVAGEGAHNGKHGGAVLPEALRFIWKGYPAPPAIAKFEGVDKRNVMDILIPGEEWQVIDKDNKYTEGPAADADGTVYFSANGGIKKAAPNGTVSTFLDEPIGADGMMMGPGGKLYVCANKANQLVVIDLQTKERKVLAADFPSVNDLVVTHKGHVYLSDHKNRQVWHVSPAGEKRVVDTGLLFPNGLTLTPDQTQLIVADMNGAGLYLYSIKEDGALANKCLFYYCHVPADRSGSGADGLAMDTQGRLYSTSRIGIQVFDMAGRVNAILPSPVPGRRPSNVEFGGPGNQYLYITVGDRVLRRKTRATGVLFFQGPVVPPAPKL